MVDKSENSNILSNLQYRYSDFDNSPDSSLGAPSVFGPGFSAPPGKSNKKIQNKVEVFYILAIAKKITFCFYKISERSPSRYCKLLVSFSTLCGQSK